MKRMTLRIFGALGLALGLTAVGLHADVIEQVLVKVNGEILTKTDVEQLQVTALRASNPNITANDLQNDVALRKMLDEVTPRVIVNAIDELLLVQRGRELGLKMSDEQFNGILANIRKENKLDTEEKFQAALKQEGLTIAGLRKAFEKQMLINRVQQQDVFSRISISEEESRAYFDAHKEEFLTNESVTLRELFVRQGAESTPQSTPDGFTQLMRDEYARYQALIRAGAGSDKKDFAFESKPGNSDQKDTADGGRNPTVRLAGSRPAVSTTSSLRYPF